MMKEETKQIIAIIAEKIKTECKYQPWSDAALREFLKENGIQRSLHSCRTLRRMAGFDCPRKRQRGFQE